jgi:hypothetical protein
MQNLPMNHPSRATHNDTRKLKHSTRSIKGIRADITYVTLRVAAVLTTPVVLTHQTIHGPAIATPTPGIVNDV